MNSAESHSSVGSVVDMKTGGRWFDPRLGQYSFRGLMIAIATKFIPLSPLSVVYVRKQPAALKEYCVEHWLKELQKSMDRCTVGRDRSEMLL